MDTVESEARITGDTVSGTKQQAETVFENLSAVGVDLDDVYRVLEDEGVQKFEKCWKELLDTIGEQLNSSKGWGVLYRSLGRGTGSRPVPSSLQGSRATRSP